MRRIVLAAIRLYQRHLSPHKGFACAYRVHTGNASCSMLGHRAVRRFGVVAGGVLLLARLRRCGVAHRRDLARAPTRPRHAMQGGFCDGCDIIPCDCAACDVAGLIDGIDCCDSCDLPLRRKRSEDEDDAVHLPVRSKR